jgi:hypothetical protein
MSDNCECDHGMFEQIRTILAPIFDKMNEGTRLSRVEIEVMFNMCDHCDVEYDNFMRLYDDQDNNKTVEK